MGAHRTRSRRTTLLLGLALTGVFVSSCTSTTKKTATTPTTVVAPKYSLDQQKAYFGDLVKDDGTNINAYVDKYGQSGLFALMAFGSGFCSFLAAGEDASTAVSKLESQGASIESRTNFDGTVNDYESIAADAILGLCPNEESHLTSAQQANLDQIRQSIDGG